MLMRFSMADNDNDDETETSVAYLHDQPSALGLLDFIRKEIDAGRMAAISIVAINHEHDVFREVWVSPNGAPAYAFLGASNAAMQNVYRRFFSEDEE